ncbi:MAG: translation factor GTPase family protein [Acutalibacteraceae bacterium]|nr:translation factor GTPase family protein [Acutalibacteraceae bacterium]
MKKLSVGILAHVDSGKTTLTEALMYCSGNISKLGRVDHRNSFLDNFALERDRGITIFSKQAILNHNNTCFTILDTPGHIDFSTETERTLQVLDYAVLVISGTSGVQSHTHTLWRLLSRYNVPTFIFVNKMDLDGADKESVIAQLKQKLSDCCVEFTAQPTSEMYEGISLCDEHLLEKFYENDTLENSDIITAIKERKVFPCFFGSALRLEGVEEFLNALDLYTTQPQYGDKFGAKVFKISEDKQGNRLTHLKITSGTLRVKTVLNSADSSTSEKVNQIRIYSGEKFTAEEAVTAGTVCAVTGITFAHSGDGLGVEENSHLPILEPVLTYRIDLPENIDVHTALKKLKILEDEDPQLNVVWNENLGEIQIQLMGEIQLEILKSVISQRFNFDVEFGKGNIIYKETISNTVEGVGHFEPLRHYAEVHLLLESTKQGSGLSFELNCSEDKLDKNWQRLILTHLLEKTHIGVLTGSPITDMKITLVAGRAHKKHTEGGDFRQATYRAVRHGLKMAESVLLEPVYAFTLEVPNENIGRAMADIQRMHGTFSPAEQNGEVSIINGTAPVATMADYQTELTQYTHGKGKLTYYLQGYEPCHNADEVIERIGYNSDNDVNNPCDSVFCSHGVGKIIKWNEVYDYMHLDSVLSPSRQEVVPLKAKDRVTARLTADCDDIFAQDKELIAIFEQTYGPIKKRENNDNNTRVKRVTSFDNPNKRHLKPVPKYTGEEYLLVDGYNVIFSWESLKKLANENLEAARNQLINILCNYQGYCKCELILVFDAYRVAGKHREVEKVNNINVVYTQEAETADMYIEKVTHKLAKNHKVRVVTSDGMEQFIILGHGALRVSSQSFLQEVKLAEDEIREIITSLK